MSIPFSLKKIAPSLKIKDETTAALSLTDLKAIFPSVEIDVHDALVPTNATIKLSIEDLRKIFRVVLSGIAVDERWYVGQVSGLRQDVENGKFASVAEHYIIHGYLEGRLPEKPLVDEKYYLAQNPDVAAAIKAGKVKNAFDHYVQAGYAEGRLASADTTGSIERP